jgi:hypothetical protein
MDDTDPSYMMDKEVSGRLPQSTFPVKMKGKAPTI